MKAEALRERQRAEQLADRLQKLTDELEQSRREPKRGNPPVVPEGFKGTVRRVEGTAKDLADGREVWVEITPGADAGLRQGTILNVRRVDRGSRRSTWGRSSSSGPTPRTRSAGSLPANPRAVAADDVPKPGDELAFPIIR